MNKIKEFFQDEDKQTVLFLVLSAFSLVISFLDIRIFKIDLAWVAIILCGLPIVKGAIKGLITEFDIKADVLVAIALVASVLIGEIFAAGEVAFIMTLGALLEERTVAKARAGIEKLVNLTPPTARIVRDGIESIIPAEEIKVSDILRVLPGETIAVDGIITYGKPAVVAIESFNAGISSEKLLELTASAELRSEHPLGKSIVSHFKTISNQTLEDPQEFELIAGRGVKSVVTGATILAGNAELLTENSIEIPKKILDKALAFIKEGCTVIYIAVNSQTSGFIVLSDTLRKDSKSMIKKLNSINVESILLTGDNPQAASHIAKSIGITNVHSECLPEDKISAIEEYQNNNEMICMIGDGINDAPALKKAYVGIAMGGIGNDITVDVADIALVSDDIKSIPHLLSPSQKTMNTIKWNLSLSMLLNFAAILLAMTGILNPILGALVHNLGSVAVIINSALLLNFKDKQSLMIN